MRSTYLPPWRIDVTVRDGVRVPAALAPIARAAARALDAAGAPAPASLGLVFSDDTELADLNAKYMGEEGSTDVLSFPLLPPAAFPQHSGAGSRASHGGQSFPLPPGRRKHLGDIIVSVERAAAQSSGSVAAELHALVVHGALHVCGWDHAAPTERSAMRALERDLLDAP